MPLRGSPVAAGPRNPELAVEALAVVAEWLRIGGGFDRPFGHKHHADCVAAAKEIGEALAAALAARSDLSLGLRVNLSPPLTIMAYQ